MLHTIIFWLQSRRLINLVLVLAYFIFIVFMHNPLVRLSMWIEHNLSFEKYQIVVGMVFVAAIALLFYYVFSQARKSTQNRPLSVFYLSATLLFLFIHSRFMFDSNVEAIHAFEFTFLAFLIFPFTRRFGAAILFALPFMLIDEWYQYIYLYPDWNDYFDLNDILTDTYGCGLTMVVLLLSGVKGNENIQPFWKRAEFITLAVLVAGVLVAVNSCYIAAYANEVCTNTLLVMNERMGSEPFMRPHPTHNLSFHVMKPAEGLLAITLLHLFYLGLDSFRVKR